MTKEYIDEYFFTNDKNDTITIHSTHVEHIISTIGKLKNNSYNNILRKTFGKFILLQDEHNNLFHLNRYNITFNILTLNDLTTQSVTIDLNGDEARIIKDVTQIHNKTLSRFNSTIQTPDTVSKHKPVTYPKITYRYKSNQHKLTKTYTCSQDKIRNTPS